jgi:hypothetical protein
MLREVINEKVKLDEEQCCFLGIELVTVIARTV